MELERENRNLRRRVSGLNDIIDRERARERIEELEHSNRILACGWRTSVEILAQAHR